MMVQLPSWKNGGNSGNPGGFEEESLELFLLTSVLSLQTVPDGRKSLPRPLTGPFSRADPQLCIGHIARAQERQLTYTGTAWLHNHLETELTHGGEKNRALMLIIKHMLIIKQRGTL